MSGRREMEPVVAAWWESLREEPEVLARLWRCSLPSSLEDLGDELPEEDEHYRELEWLGWVEYCEEKAKAERECGDGCPWPRFLDAVEKGCVRLEIPAEELACLEELEAEAELGRLFGPVSTTWPSWAA